MYRYLSMSDQWEAESTISVVHCKVVKPFAIFDLFYTLGSSGVENQQQKGRSWHLKNLNYELLLFTISSVTALKRQVTPSQWQF